MSKNADMIAMLCQRIKIARIKKNLSQLELAEKSGIGIATMKRIELGESITLQTLISVLRGLDELDQLNNVLAYYEINNAMLIDAPKRKKKQSIDKTQEADILNDSDFLHSKVNTMRWKY